MNPETLRDYSETVPFQYEDGKAVFLGMDIAVDPRVFIPRPETELLVETVVSMCASKDWDSPRVFDLGTGSGAISLGIAKAMPLSSVLAVDVSPEALDVAAGNVKKLGVGNNVTLKRSDMFSVLGEESLRSFDVIVSNPPYISLKDMDKLDAWVKAEPRTALYGGVDGLDHYRTIFSKGIFFLKMGGLMAVEVGYDQAAIVKEMLAGTGYSGIESFRDFNGHERVITGWNNG